MTRGGEKWRFDVDGFVDVVDAREVGGKAGGGRARHCGFGVLALCSCERVYVDVDVDYRGSRCVVHLRRLQDLAPAAGEEGDCDL